MVGDLGEVDPDPTFEEKKKTDPEPTYKKIRILQPRLSSVSGFRVKWLGSG